MSERKKLKDPRTCRIFFSSPFSGMEGEREELTKKYFPQIHHLCNSRGVQFVAVDMRWGITTEMTRSAQVIKICLRELDRSDMFVGFYGQRYGWHGVEDKALQENFDNAVGHYPWLDDVRDRSVTEVEYLHGHLNNVGVIPATICFRSKEYDDYMVEEGKKKGDKKQIYKYTAESEHSVNMMNDLKDRVKETEPQILSKVKSLRNKEIRADSIQLWNGKLRMNSNMEVWIEFVFRYGKTLGVLMDYETPTKGAEFMFNAIWKCLNEELLKNTQEDKPLKHNTVTIQHDAFLKNRSVMYIGGQQYITELTKNIDKDIQSSYLVTGPAGSGKSAMLCTWISGIQNDPDFKHVSLAYHFVGYAEDSTEPRSILNRLCEEFDYKINIMQGTESQPHGTRQGETTKDMTIPELVQKLLASLDKMISLGKVPVIIIDGIDKVVKAKKTEKPLFWLPPNLPPKCMVVVSTNSEDTDSINELKDERKFKVIEIIPLDTDAKEEFTVKTLRESGKELASGQLDKLVQADHTDNPLYLKITLNEMVVFGYFRLLDKKIDTLISSENVEELFEKVLQRLEDDYNVKEHPANLVEQVMSAIYLSHRGISETEVRDIFNIPSSVWSPLYFAIEIFVIEQSGLIQFAFTELKECVRKRYLKDEEKRKQYLKCLIDYFKEEKKRFPLLDTENSSVVARVTHELPWLWLQYGDRTELANTLLDIDINDTLFRESEFVLLDLWRATDLSWEQIADGYLKSLDLKLVDLYLYLETNGDLDTKSPGVIMLQRYIDSAVDMFKRTGNFKARETISLRHIRILKENLETGFIQDSRQLDRAMVDLAGLYTDFGYFDEGFKIHEEILQKRERIVEEQKVEEVNLEDISNLGASYHGLGVLYIRREDYKKAEELFLKCLEIQKPLNDKTLDKSAYLNLGVVYLMSGQHEQALEYSMKNLQIEEELNYGHLPPEIGETLSNIGLCYRRLGQFDEAEKYYHRSLEIKQKTVGNEHILCTVTLNCLSVVERLKGNMDKAFEYLNECLRIYEVCNVPENNNDYLQSRENKILYYMNIENYEEAVKEFLPFFDLIIKYDRLNTSLPQVHTDIVGYMISKEMYNEALKVTLCLIEGGVGSDRNYVHLDMLDSVMWDKGQRPERSEKFSLSYAYKLWPESGLLVRQIIKFHMIPNDNIKGILDILTEFHEVSDLGVEIYNAMNIWFSEAEHVSSEMLIAINEAAIAKYPDSEHSLAFLGNIADSWIRLKQRDKALPYLLRLLDLDPGNSQYVLLTAQTAFLVGDIDMGKKYCHMAMEKFVDTEDIVSKAKTMLDMVEEGMAQQNSETS